MHEFRPYGRRDLEIDPPADRACTRLVLEDLVRRDPDDPFEFTSNYSIELDAIGKVSGVGAHDIVST